MSRAICQRWAELQPILPHFDRHFNEYVDYRNMIPSFGAVMFSKGYRKILFSKPMPSSPLVVYKRDNQRIKKLDFAKGKADEGETDMECAAREVAEEIGYNIRPNLN